MYRLYDPTASTYALNLQSAKDSQCLKTVPHVTSSKATMSRAMFIQRQSSNGVLSVRDISAN